MPSPGASGTVAQMVKPEYRNWLALGHALTTVLCEGLRSFINREMEAFYLNLIARLASAAPCTCIFVSRRRPNQYHDMGTCAWANVLQSDHHANKPNWKQSDPVKWIDPKVGPWEIAKLFLPDLGGHTVINSAEDMDITGILNLMYWCNQFTISQTLIKDVRETRNNKWVHVSKLELTDASKKVAFDAIENLLKDPSLAHDPDVQKALKEIGNLKTVSDLQSTEAQVLADYKQERQKEISTIKAKLKENKEEQTRLEKKLDDLEKAFKEVNDRKPDERYFFHTVLFLSGCVFGNLTCLRKKHSTMWLMVLLLGHLYVVLDDSYINDGESALRLFFNTKYIRFANNGKEKGTGLATS